MRYAIAANLLLAAGVLPFVILSPPAPVQTADSADAARGGGGLAICDGQEDLLRFHLKPGGRLERDILLENRSERTISITKRNSSCDCARVETSFANLSFRPGERKSVLFVVDLSEYGRSQAKSSPRVALSSHEGEVVSFLLSVETTN